MWILLLVLAVGSLVSGEDASSLKDKIVIHTPLQNYEKPSLRDYEECQSNRQNCLNICAGREKCELECPLCPELTEEPLLVHGINDTSYVAPAQPALNTTNIIRLTNEINNIIKSDIQGRNEINIQVHQNVSKVGGRFGLGYNEQGSCCHVVRRERDCEHLEHCQESSRHRVCGARCQARVMHAKRVVQCEKDQPDECHETVEYVPMYRHKSGKRNRSQFIPKYQTQSQVQTQSDDCTYLNTWPFISCGHNRESMRLRRASCQKCLYVTYGYLLQNGMPPECTSCFPAYVSPMMPQPIVYPTYLNPGFDYNYQPLPKPQPQPNEDDEQGVDQDIEDGEGDRGWVVESDKCLGPSGELVNCKDGVINQDSSPPAHVEQEEDPYYDVPAQRRRRRHDKFVRSLYSRRG